MKNRLILFVTLSVLILSGCGGAQSNRQNEEAPPPNETLSPPNSQPAITEPYVASITTEVALPDLENPISAPRKIVEEAREALALNLGVGADQIRTVESRQVEWPDASLGCPQPDMVYAQVITSGYWILLEANEKQYPYHADRNGQFILCLGASSNSGLPVIPVKPGEIDDGQPWVPAD